MFRSAFVASVYLMSVAFAQTHSADLSLGIAPDCSEDKISIEQLLEIEKNPRISSMVDFLKAIPPKALQTFTFVHSTKSFQHHLVNEQWPRVLRMSADGKLSMSFVCHPNSQDYDRVEILYYVDPPVAAWRSVSLDFRKSKPGYGHLTEDMIYPDKAGSRVHHNEATCIKCHSPSGSVQSGLRPIIPEYKTWTGFYGSDDDVLHLNSREHTNYKKFLQNAASDPCFSTLPWPRNSVKDYELYPYHEGFDLQKTDLKKITLYEETQKIKINNYHLRPNLKFTDAYSHLMAQRLAWQLLRKPEYHRVAPLVLMEAARCETTWVTTEMQKQVPGYKPLPPLHLRTYMDPRTVASATSLLYSLSLHLGLETADYNLHFNEPNKAYYNTGAAGSLRRDTSIARMAQGVLLSEFAKSFPAVQKYYKISRGVSEFFAPQDFSCIDDVAGQVSLETIEDQKNLCAELSSIYLSQNRTSAPFVLSKDTSQSYATPIANNISDSSLLEQLIQQNPALLNSAKSFAGANKARRHCLSCHSPYGDLPTPYHFFASEEDLRQEMKKDSHFIWRALTYMQSGRMPKGSFLSAGDVEDIQAYLLQQALELEK